MTYKYFCSLSGDRAKLWTVPSAWRVFLAMNTSLMKAIEPEHLEAVVRAIGDVDELVV
jgi:hypothetical protein